MGAGRLGRSFIAVVLEDMLNPRAPRRQIRPGRWPRGSYLPEQEEGWKTANRRRKLALTPDFNNHENKANRERSRCQINV
jgi:hypothetical protein